MVELRKRQKYREMDDSLIDEVVYAVLLAAVLVLMFAGQAWAGWEAQRAQAIAARVWHHPCADNVQLAWARFKPGIMAEADPSHCLVTYSDQRVSWVSFCTTMIHEYGHLAGYRDWSNTADPYHSSNPHSVMAQNKVQVEGRLARRHQKPLHIYIGLDRRCADHGRTYLGMAPDGLAARERFVR